MPGITYPDFDLDGDAMAEDGFGAQLKHSYRADDWRLVTRIFTSGWKPAPQPDLQQTSRVDSLGGSITGFLPEPFGWKHWTITPPWQPTRAIAILTSTIQSLWMVSAGMLYRFD